MNIYDIASYRMVASAHPDELQRVFELCCQLAAGKPSLMDHKQAMLAAQCVGAILQIREQVRQGNL